MLDPEPYPDPDSINLDQQYWWLAKIFLNHETMTPRLILYYNILELWLWIRIRIRMDPNLLEMLAPNWC